MLSIAIAGLGTVGAAAFKRLQEYQKAWPISVKAVSARDKNRDRGCSFQGVEWVDNPLELAQRTDISTVVELIGGADGMALELARTTLKSGKNFVTANKAMLGKHGAELSALAETHGVHVGFEASVCGGIPVIKAIRESLAGDEIFSLSGIMNGTTNYILSRMANEGLEFDAVLAEAQSLGYAEADPTADVDGYDAASKLAILIALARGGAPDISGIKRQGIRNITRKEISAAAESGCVLKLIARAEHNNGIWHGVVEPTLVPLTSPLSKVDGALNAVMITTRYAGPIFLSGAGAGGEATATAVLADLFDLARGVRLPLFP